MKNSFKLLVLLSIFMLTTGFYTMDAKINFKDDKSVSFYMKHTINEPLYNNAAMDKSINQLLQIEKINKNLLTNGFKVDDYKKNNETGVIISKKFDNIEKISTPKNIKININEMIEDNFDHSKYFKVTKKGLLSTVVANLVIDTTKIENTTNDYNFEVVLPVKSESNNATHISSDSLVLTWKLKENAKNEINFTFKLRDKEEINTLLYTFIIITTITFITILVKKNYKKD